MSLQEYLKVADNLISNFSNSTELQDAHKDKANVIFGILDASNDVKLALDNINNSECVSPAHSTNKQKNCNEI